jgi:hypothetical protein
MTMKLWNTFFGIWRREPEPEAVRIDRKARIAEIALEKRIEGALMKGKCICGGTLLEGPSGGMAVNVLCDTCSGRLNVYMLPYGPRLGQILDMPRRP